MTDNEPRFWVNDSGPTLTGKVGENEPGYPVADAKGFVGIVDEEAGGMVLYCDPRWAERYCGLLNGNPELES